MRKLWRSAVVLAGVAAFAALPWIAGRYVLPVVIPNREFDAAEQWALGFMCIAAGLMSVVGMWLLVAFTVLLAGELWHWINK